MAYPQEALAHGEELLLHRHPHWKMLFLPAITFIVATTVAGFAIGVTQSKTQGTASTVLLAVIAVAWIGLVSWRSIAPLISWKATHFIVTDRRVLIRQGVIAHSGIDIPMNRISNVQFRHGLIDRMLRTGTLIIASNSDEPLEFDDIPYVQRVHSLLYQQVFDSGENRDQRRDSDRGYTHEPQNPDDWDPELSKQGWRTGKPR